jgi:putative transposase
LAIPSHERDQTSTRPYSGLPALEYPFHDLTVIVTQCGCLCFGRRKVNLSQVFAGQNVGVREVADHIWLISFMHYDLGFFDDQCSRVECAPNPFTAKVLPMSPAPCVRVVVGSSFLSNRAA